MHLWVSLQIYSRCDYMVLWTLQFSRLKELQRYCNLILSYRLADMPNLIQAAKQMIVLILITSFMALVQ
jgi:hypothetical protein